MGMLKPVEKGINLPHLRAGSPLLPRNIMLTPPTATSASGYIVFDVVEPQLHVALSTSHSPTDPANPFGTAATITPLSKFIRHYGHDTNAKDSAAASIERTEDSSKRYCYIFVGFDNSKMNPTSSMILTSNYRELLVYPSPVGHFVEHTDQQPIYAGNGIFLGTLLIIGYSANFTVTGRELVIPSNSN